MGQILEKYSKFNSKFYNELIKLLSFCKDNKIIQKGGSNTSSNEDSYIDQLKIVSKHFKILGDQCLKAHHDRISGKSKECLGVSLGANNFYPLLFSNI